MKAPFAVFAVAPIKSIRSSKALLYAATTRPASPGKIGLPGGKVEKGEDPKAALRREASEEGWNLVGDRSSFTLIHEDVVDGNLVHWYRVPSALPLADYKEKGRLYPIAVPLQMIAESGMGNEFLATQSNQQQ